MSVVHNKFENPATSESYTWHLNHDEEDSLGKTRNITRTAPTGIAGGNVGMVKQQADDGPLLLKLSGKILQRAQLQAFWDWYETCQTHTIYFTDFDGNKFEVQITSFLPKRVRVVHNPGDESMPLHYWTYQMEMEVYAVLDSDDFEGVTP
jgi:hypothetical protein